MRDDYKPKGLSIRQTADLYGITIDTLYYYEKIDLVVPERNPENGYRVYTEHNFETLNIVVTLLNMDFSLAQIKRYLQSHYLDENISLLRTELANLNDMLGRLRERQKGVESALIRYTQALLEAPLERIKLVWMPARPVLSLGASPDKDTSLPLLAACRSYELGIGVNVFHVQPLFSITTEINEQGTFDGIDAYLYSESGLGVEDDELAEGYYLTVTFRGSAKRTPELYEKILAYAHSNSLVLEEPPLEFWTVNEYVSNDPNEFIHTLQIRVADKTEQDS